MATSESSTEIMSDNYVSPTGAAIPAIPEYSNTNPAIESFDDDEDEDCKSLNGGVKPWDEGGLSDCGYNDTVHSTLMKVGETIHNVVGAPTSKSVISVQKSIGNWFQELSYAARDILHGSNDNTSLTKDTADAIHTVMTGGGLPDDDDDIDEPNSTNDEKKLDY